jgi:hypothetical protein
MTKRRLSRRAALAGALAAVPAVALPPAASAAPAGFRSELQGIATRHLELDAAAFALWRAAGSSTPESLEIDRQAEELLHLLAERPATSIADLKAKALVLRDRLDESVDGGPWKGPDGTLGDPTEMLAWSLCNDLLALEG